MVDKPSVKWSDIAGLESAKLALKEAVILPIQFPRLFTENRKPWRSILLFGPPGTGKSYIAKAVATEAESSNFFSVSASDFTSNCLGESEKRVKNLFAMARDNKPSIIFIDEIESLFLSGSAIGCECALRLKAEFLIQMKGFGPGVLVLGATNSPWTLDAAVRRCFEKFIYVPLPDVIEREEMFRIVVGKNQNNLSEEDYTILAERTEGYSCYDIHILVKDALMQPFRRAALATHFKYVTRPSPSNPKETVVDFLAPCSPGDQGARSMSILDVPSDKLVEPILTMKDVEKSFLSMKPTENGHDMDTWRKFKEEIGQ